MISVTDQSFNPAEALAAFEKRAHGAGAIVTFIGAVREDAGSDTVEALVLEHYPGVTEQSIAEIASDAKARWPISAFEIIHRVGRLGPGEPIVMVAVASAHGRAAFEAADFLMDYLKTEALFWKKEIRAGGEIWIEPRADDYKHTALWDEKKESN